MTSQPVSVSPESGVVSSCVVSARRSACVRAICARSVPHCLRRRRRRRRQTEIYSRRFRPDRTSRVTYMNINQKWHSRAPPGRGRGRGRPAEGDAISARIRPASRWECTHSAPTGQRSDSHVASAPPAANELDPRTFNPFGTLAEPAQSLCRCPTVCGTIKAKFNYGILLANQFASWSATC